MSRQQSSLSIRIDDSNCEWSSFQVPFRGEQNEDHARIRAHSGLMLSLPALSFGDATTCLRN
jgi:hypothetical protein